MKHLRNTPAVLVLTIFTALAVFTAIQLGGRLFGTSTASAQTVITQAAQSRSSGGNGYGHGSGGAAETDPYGNSGGSSSAGGSSGSGSSSGGQTYTCPATGCTASTCHATQ